MTLSSETRRDEYTGDNTTDTYNYTFQIQDEDDLLVTTRDPGASPAQPVTTLVKTTDYTVTGVGNTGGGTIVLVAGNLATNVVLVIQRKVTLTQPTGFRNQASFLPENHEDALDRIIMALQEVKANYGVPTGAIFVWPTALGPSPGYLLCNGDEVSRTEYADLFALIGTTFGTGDGSTTFDLPTIADKGTNLVWVIKT
jgi:hypothetical protein